MEQNALFSLDGQVAVVIGGGGVLAGAMATGFAEAGADAAGQAGLAITRAVLRDAAMQATSVAGPQAVVNIR
jgi:NAD(P)-dependent dehydrogenase (short-subunit alcohol dehydrogenase family)